MSLFVSTPSLEHHCNLVFGFLILFRQLRNHRIPPPQKKKDKIVTVNTKELPRNYFPCEKQFPSGKKQKKTHIFHQRANSCAGKRVPNGSDVSMTQTTKTKQWHIQPFPDDWARQPFLQEPQNSFQHVLRNMQSDRPFQRPSRRILSPWPPAQWPK